MEIQMTSDISKNIGVSAFVYGKAGIGKTYMAKFMEKPLVLNLDGGLTTLKAEKIPYLDVNPQNIDEAINTARASDYKTIFFDSFSMLESMLLTSYAQESKSTVPTLMDYGKLIMRLQEYLLKLRDLRFQNKNVVITALEQVVKIEESDHSFQTFLYPLIMAKKGMLIQRMVGDVDVVAHLEMGKEQRFLRVEATDKVFAKSRIHTRESILPQDLFKEDKPDEN